MILFNGSYIEAWCCANLPESLISCKFNCFHFFLGLFLLFTIKNTSYKIVFLVKILVQKINSHEIGYNKKIQIFFCLHILQFCIFLMLFCSYLKSLQFYHSLCMKNNIFAHWMHNNLCNMCFCNGTYYQNIILMKHINKYLLIHTYLSCFSILFYYYC